MRKSVRTSVIALLAISLACIAAASAAAAPAAIDITKIPSSFKDWEGQYNEMLESWTFQNYAGADSDSFEQSTFYVDKVSDADAGSFNDYSKNLKKKDWLDLTFVWKEISSNEKLADGFVFIGKSLAYKDKEAKPLPSFVVVRKFKNTSIRCKGDATSDALLKEAIDFCKSLK